MALARGRKSIRDIASELSECNGFHLFQAITEDVSQWCTNDKNLRGVNKWVQFSLSIDKLC